MNLLCQGRFTDHGSRTPLRATPGVRWTSAPRLGEHTHEILMEEQFA